MAAHRRLSKVFWQMLCASERNTALFPSSMWQEQRDVRHVSPRLRVTSPRDVGSQLRLPRCSWANDKEGISHPSDRFYVFDISSQNKIRGFLLPNPGVPSTIAGLILERVFT
jgi:hypothetical protein